MADNESNTRVIIDVTLNSQDATKKANDLGVSIKAVKEEQKELKAAGKETDAAFVSNAQNLRLLTAEQKAYIQIANAAEGSNNQLRAQLALLTQQYNALGKAEREDTVAGKALTIQIKGLSDELKKNESAVGDNRRNVGNYKDALVSSTEAIDSQKQALSRGFAGFKQYDSVIAPVTTQVKAFRQALQESKVAQQELEVAQKIANETTETAAKLKEKATQIGFKYASGQATEAQVVAANTVATDANIVATAAQTAATEAQVVATGKASAAMKVFKVAIASTGIGAIVIIVVALLNYLSKFDPVMDRVEQAFAAVGAVVNRVAGIVIDFFRELTSVGDFLSKIGSILADPIGSFKRLGDEIAKTAAAAVELKKAQQDLEDQQKIQEVRNARELQQIQELTLKSRNRSLSEKERIALLAQASKLDEKNFKDRTKIADKERELAIRKIAEGKNLTDSEIARLRREGIEYAFVLKDKTNITDEELDMLKDADIKKTEILTEATNREEKRQNQADALAEKAAAAEEKRQAKLEELRKKNQDAEQARLDSLLRTNADMLTARQAEMAEINRDIDEKIAKYKEYGRTTEQLEKERVARLAQVAAQYNKQDLETVKANQRLIEDIRVNSIKDQGERQLAQLKINTQRELEENDRASTEIAERVLRGETGLEQLFKSVGETRQAILREDSLARQQIIDENYTIELEKFNQHQVDLANAALINEQSEGGKLAANALLLDAQYQQEIDAAIRRGEDTTLIAAEYDDKRKQMDKAVNDAAFNSFKNFSGSFQGLVKENTAAYKIAGAIQAKVDAAQVLRNNILIIQENIKALSSQGKLPFPENIIAIFSTLAALGAGIAAARTLVQPVALATGGVFTSDGKGAVLPGYSKQDNTNAFLRSGEAVIVSEAARDPKALAALSAINVAYGGRALAPGVAMAAGGIARGGFIDSISTDVSNSANIIDAVIAGVTSAPPPILDVRDVTTSQQRQANTVANIAQ